ncbi:MAG: zinc-dependent metalloprotease [Cytophagaceae bacterium]|nr:zinc-dependent metalloprotease [Cytophagaceae bacterium]
MKKQLLQILFLCVTGILPVFSQEDILKDTQKNEGYFTFYWNEAKGKVFLEVKNIGEEFLYYPSLAEGLGSNDIGLDRGLLGQEHILKFEKTGNKLLLIEPNYQYRANSNDILEKNAVKESFAKSVWFGFEILKNINGNYIIDLTPFLLRDAIEAGKTLSSTKQGNFSFDALRSGIYSPMCKSFPQNTEFQVVITLMANASSNPGQYINSIVPTSDYVSMHQHHSFVKLPEPGFKTREFDPRIGYIGIDYFDYSSPINAPIQKKLISRHRLEKKDPNAVLSEPVKPIVYYLDSGVPEPIRSALFEGATWWNQAFEAAGYKDAFQVKMLPADADPMDIRYNLVQWVHRSTRGWSYGTSIIDPRTGEILKGKVSLGSLRVRQDYLLAQGLAGDFSPGKSDTLLTKMALDRLKQLSAHEIGHTLGLPHNYISSINGRASVMDYPHPLVYLKDGKVKLDEAYSMGIGEYDKSSIIWGYQDFPKGVNEKMELERIVKNLFEKRLQFLTDQDARPDGSVHPQTHLWDNGSNATEELTRVIEMRKVVLSEFDDKKIPDGTPLAQIEEVFVPMYMLHRYQVQAASKSLAGAYYSNALKGDNQLIFKPVSADDQRKSLKALVQTLEPDFLAMPKQLLGLIPPRPFRYPANNREVFKRRTGMTFDVLAPAESSAQLTLSLILEPKRISRLATQQIYDKNLPSLAEVLNLLTQRLLNESDIYKNNYFGQIKRVVAEQYVYSLKMVLVDNQCNVEAKSNIAAELKSIENRIVNKQSQAGGFGMLILDIIRKPESDFEKTKTNYLIAPDGQPIDEEQDWLGCENLDQH